MHAITPKPQDPTQAVVYFIALTAPGGAVQLALGVEKCEPNYGSAIAAAAGVCEAALSIELAVRDC